MRATAAMASVSVKSSADRVRPSLPVVLQDEEQFVGGERPVLVDEADPAVELRVAGEALFDAGHADEDHAELAAVVVVAELLQCGGLEPVGLVDDEQLDEGRQGMGDA